MLRRLKKTTKALKRCWNKDHYRRAGLITLPASFGLMSYLIFSGGFFLPEWFLNLLLPVGFIGSAVSGATYIARPLDKQTSRAEKIGTAIFAGIGLAISIAIGVLGKVSGIGGIIKLATTCIGNISSFAGLGNRLSSTTNKDVPKNERRAKTIGAVVGAGIGAALCICAKTALLGAASLFIPGAAIVLPAVLSSVVLGASMSSTGASACDYVSKAWNYVQYLRGKASPALKKRIEESPHEYRGSAVGVGLGIAAAIVICACMPHVAAGIVGIAIGCLVVAGCCAMVGGICSRIGRMLDGCKAKKAISTNVETPANNNVTSQLLSSNKPTPQNSAKKVYSLLNDKESAIPAPTLKTALDEAQPAYFPSPIAAPAPKLPCRTFAAQPTPAFTNLIPQLAY